MIPNIILSIENTDDRDFMERLYNNYKRLMYSEINKITKDHWLTEDILHSALEKLIARVSLLRQLPKAKLINYIITASKNTAFNYFRSVNHASEVEYNDDIDSLGNSSNEIDDQLLLKEALESVNSAWKLLDDRNKRLLEMKYILEKTNAEISEELGIQKNSVRMYLTRARNSLKKKIKDAEMV